MLKKTLLAASLIFAATNFTPASFAQEAQQAEEKRYEQLSYNVGLNQPIKVSITYKNEQGGAVMEAKEVNEVVALRQEGDAVIYNAKVMESELLSATGIPEDLVPTLEQLGKQSIGMEYQYSADATGYPIALQDTAPINKFMKKANKSLKKWVKKFAKKNKLSKAERQQLMAMSEQSMAPYLSDDATELGHVVLETPQMVFYGTGRGLYFDYYTVFNTTRYLEDAEISFHTVDEWAINSWDTENGVAELSFTQKMNEEEHQAFLGRLRENLVKENNPNVDAYVNAYAAIEMTREGSYVMDMKSGLPISGTVTSYKKVDGNEETETISFTVSY